MITLTRVDQAQNMARFYVLDIQPTLFGEIALVREWGRIGSAGRVQSIPYPSETEAQAAYRRQLKAKVRRGYVQSSH
jgi:predicted DNA-binding WGR domain protein